MLNPTGKQIDLKLWRRMGESPRSEWWKWNWEKIWDPLFSQLYRGEADLKDLRCPICDHNDLYAYFEVFHVAISGSQREGRPVYVANRYFGCHFCKTQVRDFGEVPHWVRDDDINWVSKKAKQEARKNLLKIKLALPNDV